MQDKILYELKKLEYKKGIKILFACEAGSRAWGMASTNSDYDVRFIYVHPTDYYLSIDGIGTGTSKDIIELPIDELLDINGWDLTKALKLFRKSNPSLLEWFGSEIVYYEEYSTIKGMKHMVPQIFSPKTCLYHYLSMAEINLNKCLKTVEVSVKDFLNAIKPILISRWIQRFNEFPPIGFENLLEHVVPEESIKSICENLLELKKSNVSSAPRLMKENILPLLNTEIRSLKVLAGELTVEKQNPTEQLNHLFRDALKEVWSKEV